jgi:O-antigen ligase
MGMLLCIVASLVPLLIAPHALFYFDVTPKVAVLLLGTAALLPWFALRGEFGALFSSRRGRWLCRLLAAQGVSLALGAWFSTNRALSHTGTNWRRFGAITQLALLLFTVILAAYIAAHPGWVHRLLAAISASGALIALYAIGQYFGWDPWLPAQAYHVGRGIWTIVRPPGTLGHASYLANYLLYAVFAGTALALAVKSPLARALGLAATGLGAVAIILSGTRAAILGLALGMVFLAARPRRSWIRAVVPAAILLACGALFYFSPPGRMLRNRTRWYVEDPLGGARLLLWRDSLAMAGHNWIAGSGIETFSTEFPRYQSAGLARAFPDFYHESPHNVFLDDLTAQGILGFTALVLLSGLGVRQAFRGWSNKALPHQALSAGFLAGLVSQQFTSFTIPTALYFYLTLALVVAWRESPPAASGEGGSAGAAKRYAAALVGSAAAAIFCLFAVHLLTADRYLALVQRALEREEVEKAATLYRTARMWEPPGMSADLWYSRAMAQAVKRSPLTVGIPAWRQGLEAAIRATASAEDRHNAWYNLAAFYASQNDFKRTVESLREAIRWAPNWFKPHWMLAQVFRAEGRLPEAAAEAAQAEELDAGRNPEVSRTGDEIRAALHNGRR